MAKENKIELALKWVKAQLGKYVQPCRTLDCKYNSDQNGSVACNNPTAMPDTDDLKKGNVEEGHPLWNFYCMRFVRTAFGAPSGEYPKAEDMYQALKKANTISTDSNIPIFPLEL